MRLGTRLIGVLALVPLALAGCGSSGPSLPKDIPAANAQGLLAYLDRAQLDCNIGDPFSVGENAQNFRQAVADLPSSVDPEVITVLRRGADSLKALARDPNSCGGATGASGPTGFVPPTTSTTAAEFPSTTSKSEPTPHAKPKPQPKPKPKPKPAPAPAQPGNAPGHTGAPGQTGGGSGGVGVGPGAKAKGAKAR